MTLRNRGDSPAHFAVYPYAGELERPLHVDVAREHVERLALAGDAYRLGVQGPNRFWCELAGTRSGAAGRVDVRPRAVGFRSLLSLELELENEGDETVHLRLKALGHGRHDVTVRVRPGRTRTVTWDTDQGWYDVEVTAREDGTFRRRLTGRVETRRSGVTP